jgi:hypothetical protein
MRGPALIVNSEKKNNVISLEWWCTPAISGTWKWRLRRTWFKASPEKKVRRPLISTNKLSMVVYVCTPSYRAGPGGWVWHM